MCKGEGNLPLFLCFTDIIIKLELQGFFSQVLHATLVRRLQKLLSQSGKGMGGENQSLGGNLATVKEGARFDVSRIFIPIWCSRSSQDTKELRVSETKETKDLMKY